MMDFTRPQRSRRTYLISTPFILFFLGFFLLKPWQDVPSTLKKISYKSSYKGYSRLNDVYNATLGFGKIFVLNLPERTDKRDALVLSAAVTGLEFDFMPGVRGESISQKALPAELNTNLKPAELGVWRAHVNAMQEIVRQGLGSGLILEDDVDWDIRVKDIMRDVAISSNAALQAKPGSRLDFDELDEFDSPTDSPYGDGWDVIWVGHCGMSLTDNTTRIVHRNDVTVPETQYQTQWNGPTDSLASYPNHTRVMTFPEDGVCMFSYAISQKGARNLLLSIGQQYLTHPVDILLRLWCEGKIGGSRRSCWGVLPQLFDQHRPKGRLSAESDISKIEDQGKREVAYTPNVRWSVRLNMESILSGKTAHDKAFHDQFPDTTNA